MKQPFYSIGLIGTHTNPQVAQTLKQLIAHLAASGYRLYLEEEAAEEIDDHALPRMAVAMMHEVCDLAIVVGGDGNLLAAARCLSKFHVPIVGVNRGALGFLTDISPQHLEHEIDQVLAGQYTEEHRFLLRGCLKSSEREDVVFESNAMNDIVLSPGGLTRMLQFEIFINGQFVCSQRADGLIASTPTGSTAYSLSGGGPIMHPEMAAISLLPMFPHNLSSRPLVVSADHHIVVRLAPQIETNPRLSFDSQVHVELKAKDEIHIYQQQEKLRLLHPVNYNYYAVLRGKLNWEQQLY